MNLKIGFKELEASKTLVSWQIRKKILGGFDLVEKDGW